VIFFNNLRHPSGHVTTRGINLVGGAGRRDDEQIVVKLASLGPQYPGSSSFVSSTRERRRGSTSATSSGPSCAPSTPKAGDRRYNLADDESGTTRGPWCSARSTGKTEAGSSGRRVRVTRPTPSGDPEEAPLNPEGQGHETTPDLPAAWTPPARWPVSRSSKSSTDSRCSCRPCEGIRRRSRRLTERHHIRQLGEAAVPLTDLATFQPRSSRLRVTALGDALRLVAECRGREVNQAGGAAQSDWKRWSS